MLKRSSKDPNKILDCDKTLKKKFSTKIGYCNSFDQFEKEPESGLHFNYNSMPHKPKKQDRKVANQING